MGFLKPASVLLMVSFHIPVTKILKFHGLTENSDQVFYKHHVMNFTSDSRIYVTNLSCAHLNIFAPN